MENIDGSYLIFILLIILFIIIYLSLYYSKSLNDKFIEFKKNLANWFFNLYKSKDGNTLKTKYNL
jgi:uncharacterized protein (UPF0333 family)